MKIYSRSINEFSQNEYNRAFEMMSLQRQEAVLRMKFEGDRKRSVLGELLARKGISEALGMEEADIIFGRAESGKPYCENADIHFSISHCKDVAVAVVDNRKIGIDVEFIRDIDFRITRFACVDSDMEFINQAPDQQEKLLNFFRIWTAKEAYVKYLGTGIKDLKTVSYCDIKDRCEAIVKDGYMITTYV